MGKTHTFVIKLTDQSNGVYMPGQIISGTVLIIVEEETPINAIRLEVNGFCFVHWYRQRHQKVEGDNDGDVRDTESYIKETLILCGKGTQQGEKSLSVGRHEYPFQYKLADNLPYSFHTELGYVKYSLKATIDRPWKFDQHTEIPFKVATIYDLNSCGHDVFCGVDAEHHSHVCCCCCKSGPIKGRLIIAGKSGFVPGDMIPVKLETNNSTKRDIDLEISLVMSVKYICAKRGRFRTRRYPLTKYHKGKVLPRFESSVSQDITVPTTPPSDMKHCNLMDVSYLVVGTLSPSGGRKKEVTCTVIIGSVSLDPNAPPQAQSGFVQQTNQIPAAFTQQPSIELVVPPYSNGPNNQGATQHQMPKPTQYNNDYNGLYQPEGQQHIPGQPITHQPGPSWNDPSVSHNVMDEKPVVHQPASIHGPSAPYEAPPSLEAPPSYSEATGEDMSDKKQAL